MSKQGPTDLTGYADASDFDLANIPELQAWPQGVYPAVVKTAVWKQFRSGNYGFAFSADVTGPDGEEKLIFWNNALYGTPGTRDHNRARSQMREAIVAMGIDPGALDRHEIQPEEVAQQVVGARIALRLKPGKDQNGQPREEVDFGGVLPPERAAQAEATEFKF